MLTQEDLKQIKEVVKEVVSPEFSYMHEQFEFMHESFDMIDGKFQAIDTRFERIEAQILSLPTKDYIDGKIGELRGEFILRLKTA
jgi:hypothetical protein